MLATLQELQHLGVGFVLLTEALDLTTAAGRAMARLLAVFAEFEKKSRAFKDLLDPAHTLTQHPLLGNAGPASLHR
jgi:putative DNA-invertase from lambdoid prophage Rac